MADESERAGMMSEQQEAMELRRDTGEDRGLRRDDEAAGPQYTAPDGGGDFGDDEATAIADEAGSSYPVGPEHQAMHVEGEDRSREDRS